MLDDLRQQAEETNFEDSDELTNEQEENAREKKRRFPSLPSLGLTPRQRFFLALLLLITTCLISSLVLLMTGKIAIPAF